MRCNASKESSNGNFPLVSHRSGEYFFDSPCNLLHVHVTAPRDMQGSRCFVSLSPQKPSYSRRHTMRVETPGGVWVYWRCNGKDNVSRVRDLGAGGLFITTPDSDWRRRYVHLAMRREKSIAKVAMGGRLAVRLYWMWRNGWEYSQSVEFGSHAGQLEIGHGVK